MAGIGVKLNKIYEKNTILSSVYGFGYSTLVTVAPMFTVILVIVLVQWGLNYSAIDYSERELFASTILYIFVFSLLAASPFNAVLSRYLSDTIYEERYQDIMPCYYVGLIMTLVFGCLAAIPFCIHEYVAGNVPLYYVFTGYMGFVALFLVFYSMLYLSITKDYKKISFFFFLGMVVTLILTVILNRWLGWEVTYALLVSLVFGFFTIASLEFALVKSYFRINSRMYKQVLVYFRKYWQLILINFFYTLGLYVHNFVFWTRSDHLVVANSFVSHMNYDMATCLAMFTNISATVIFISRIEMNFHDRYKAYSEAVIGGRGSDIRNTKKRMFRQLADELFTLVRLQFIITVIVFLLCVVNLPRLGFGGSTMTIYHGLAVGYFILFIMYSEILFLYYFNDLTGALWTSISFLGVTLVGSIISSHLSEVWYGMGLIVGAFTGWSIAYFRLRWLEKNLDMHVFCQGSILKKGVGPKPSGKVFDRRETNKLNDGVE